MGYDLDWGWARFNPDLCPVWNHGLNVELKGLCWGGCMVHLGAESIVLCLTELRLGRGPEDA